MSTLPISLPMGQTQYCPDNFGQEGQTSSSLQGHNNIKVPRQAIYHTTYFICLLLKVSLQSTSAGLERVPFSPPANPTPTLRCSKCTCRQTVHVLDRNPVRHRDRACQHFPWDKRVLSGGEPFVLDRKAKKRHHRRKAKAPRQAIYDTTYFIDLRGS